MGNLLLPERLAGKSEQVLYGLEHERQEGLHEVSRKTLTQYSDLAKMTLTHVIANPSLKDRLRRLGPAKNAYGINIGEIGGAYLRLNYYLGKNISATPEELSAEYLNADLVGTPHNHIGDISGFFAVGGLTQQTYKPVDGGHGFRAGFIEYERQAANQASTSRFVENRIVGLQDERYLQLGAGGAYSLDRTTPHVVEWVDSTISIWVSAPRSSGPPHRSTTFMPGIYCEPEGLPRGLEHDEQEFVWNSLISQIQLTGIGA